MRDSAAQILQQAASSVGWLWPFVNVEVPDLPLENPEDSSGLRSPTSNHEFGTLLQLLDPLYPMCELKTNLYSPVITINSQTIPPELLPRHQGTAPCLSFFSPMRMAALPTGLARSPWTSSQVPLIAIATIIATVSTVVTYIFIDTKVDSFDIAS